MATYVQLFAEQSANFSSTITLTNASTNAAMDIASSNFTANLKKSYYTTNVAAQFTCTKDDANSTVTISLSADQTEALEQGRYVYDVKRKTGSETIKIIEGDLILTPSVT